MIYIILTVSLLLIFTGVTYNYLTCKYSEPLTHPVAIQRYLNNNWMAIRTELDQVPNTMITEKPRSRPAWGNSITETPEAQELLELHETKQGWVTAWSLSDTVNSKWLNYGLIVEGNPLGINAQKCPNTMSVLRKIPGIRTAGFSLIKAHGRIEEHTDHLSSRNRSCHLGLRVPVNCFCRVKYPNQIVTHNHKEGESFFFNSRYPHSAENNSDQDRVVLYLDIEFLES